MLLAALKALILAMNLYFSHLRSIFASFTQLSCVLLDVYTFTFSHNLFAFACLPLKVEIVLVAAPGHLVANMTPTIDKLSMKSRFSEQHRHSIPLKKAHQTISH